MTIAAGNNTTVDLSDTGTVTIGSAEDVTYQTVAANDSLTVGSGSSVTAVTGSGITTGTVNATTVNAGTTTVNASGVTVDSGNALTTSGLTASSASVAGKLTAGSIETAGTVTASGFVSGNTAVNTSGLATTGTVSAGTVSADTVTAGSTTMNSTGVTVDSGNKLTTAGLTAASAAVSGNLSAGTITAAGDVTVGKSISLSADSGLVTMGSATIGGIRITAEGLNANGQLVTNIESGSIKAGDTSAVSGSEVYQYLTNNYVTSSAAGWTVTANGGSAYRVGQNGTVDVVSGKNIAITLSDTGSLTVATADKVTFSTVSASDSVTVGSGSETSSLTGSALTITDTNGSATMTADGFSAGDGNSLTASGLQTTSIASTGDVTVGSGITLAADTGLITANGATLGGVVIGPIGINMNGAAITNLASGTIGADSTTAVNGSDVYKYVTSNYTTTAASGWTAAVTDGDTESSFKVGTSGTVTYAAGDNIDLAASGSTITVSTSLTPAFTSAMLGSESTGYTTISGTGVTLSNGASFTTSGINAAGETISNLGEGTISETSTDAVTGGQVWNLINDLTTSISTVGTDLSDATYTKVTGFTITDGVITLTTEEAHLNETTTTTTTPVVRVKSLAATSSATVTDLGSNDVELSGNDVTDTVVYRGGQNITVTTDGNDLIFSTVDDPTFNSVTVGNTSITTDGVAVGNSSLTSSGLTVGSTAVTSSGVTVGDTSLTSAGVTVGNTAVTSSGVTVGDTSLTASGLTVGNSAVTSSGFSVSGGPSMTSSGIDAGSLRITNVKAGEISSTSSDAVVGSQLYQTNQAVSANAAAINDLARSDAKLNRRINDVGAEAAALSSLHPLPFDENHRVSVSVGGGAYHGSGAAAVGIFIRPTENSMISLGGAVGNDDVMGNMSFSYRFGGESLEQKPAQMQAKLVSLDSENRDLSAQLAAARTRIEGQDQKLATQGVKLQKTQAKTIETQGKTLSEQKATIESQETAIRNQKAELKDQELRLQKLEAEFELRKGSKEAKPRGIEKGRTGFESRGGSFPSSPFSSGCCEENEAAAADA